LTLCEVDLNIQIYNNQTIGHLVACQNNADILEYLSTSTNFNFMLKDKNGKTTLDEIKDNNELKAKIE
jgi:hypothetical protein